MFKNFKISFLTLAISVSVSGLATDKKTASTAKDHCHDLVTSLRHELAELQVDGTFSLWLRNTRQLFNGHAEQDERHRLNGVIDQATELQQNKTCSATHKIAIDNVLSDALDLDARIEGSKKSYLTNNLLALGTVVVIGTTATLFAKMHKLQKTVAFLAEASTPETQIRRGRLEAPNAPHVERLRTRTPAFRAEQPRRQPSADTESVHSHRCASPDSDGSSVSGRSRSHVTADPSGRSVSQSQGRDGSTARRLDLGAE